MPHINKIPMKELLNDLCAASFEMGIAKVGLAVAKKNPDEIKVKTVEELFARYDGNEKQVATIRKEILRRLK